MSSVKAQNDCNRSFVVEVTVVGSGSPPQTILLQAESEEMRTRWITVITNAGKCGERESEGEAEGGEIDGLRLLLTPIRAMRGRERRY